MTSTRLGAAIVAVAASACDSGSPSRSDVGASDIASYRYLADQVAAADTSYRASMMDAHTTLVMCADVHATYDQQVRPLVVYMVALSSALDHFMAVHEGAAEADLECSATAMMHELDVHAAAACSSPNIDHNRAEVLRHVDAMTSYTDHAQLRCDEMMAGLDGAGWNFGAMMPGCGGMMGPNVQ